MDYKWYEIRKKVVSACKKTFAEQGVLLSQLEIEDATDLFDRIISFPLQCPIVANLQQDLQQSLQGAFVDHIGYSADLRNVMNLLDAFLKKVLVMAQVKTSTDIVNERLTLKHLLQTIGASATFNGITNTITEANALAFDKDATGAFIFCQTYLGRNTVHESREMDPEEVYRLLRYTVATYILVTHHMASTLHAIYPNLATNIKINLSEINETGYVYDFINYGNTTNKIKNRIFESFISNYIYNRGGVAPIEAIVKEVVAFSRQSLSEGAIRSLIGKMMPNKVNYENAYKKTLVLNEDENNRIKKALDNYSLLVSRLLTEIEILLDRYNLKGKAQDVYTNLKKFFETNCLSIIKLMDNYNVDSSEDHNEEYINQFKSYLKQIGCGEEDVSALFRELMHICALNDVLVKIALGKNFTNISNPDAFTSGLQQRQKIVYLDTQLLLYALCENEEFEPYNSPSYLIVKNLIDISRKHPSIHLATINQYVIEVAYHLKRALQLIVFDDIYHNSRIKLSDNVFYGYYYYLKQNDLINNNDTLSDFLFTIFDVDYDDLLQGNFESNYYSLLSYMLEHECGIQVEETHLNDIEIEKSEKVFTTALLRREDNRSTAAAKKDAIMGSYLFTNNQNVISEPFFLSWDKAFIEYRKDYIKQFIRGGMPSWHIFNPAKFVNHLNLLDMKINVDVMTEDLISIIEDDDTAANTKHVLDSISRLLEKSNVTERKKRKVYSEIIFNETDFPNDTVLPDESKLKLTNDFALAFDKLLTMMQTNNHNFGEFATIISQEKRFKQIVSIMSKKLTNESVEQCASSMFNEILKEISHTDSKQME